MGKLWVLVTIVLVVAAFFLGKILQKNPIPPPPKIAQKAPFSVCKFSTAPKHSMGPVCKGNGQLCELTIDDFASPMGGSNHDSDPACAIWASYLQSSSLKIADKGSNPADFTLSFGLEPESLLDPNCAAIPNHNPYGGAAILNSNNHVLTLQGPIDPNAINCHFKMTLKQGSATYDPHLYGDM